MELNIPKKFIDIACAALGGIVGFYLLPNNAKEVQAKTNSLVSENKQLKETETNLEIYGNDIYLDQVEPRIFRICSEDDPYEKHLTWDYGAQAYYDRGSDCYLWYNTDVSPNLWQYWYEDIAGSNYYGWMECEGEDWYIEVSDTEWEEYEGDTSGLWHIENEFD